MCVCVCGCEPPGEGVVVVEGEVLFGEGLAVGVFNFAFVPSFFLTCTLQEAQEAAEQHTRFLVVEVGGGDMCVCV